MRWKIAFLAVAMILVLPATVKAAESAPDSILLTLDQGFVGRPVSLDLFDGVLNVSWDEDTLIGPSALVISLTEGTTSTEDQVVAAPAVSVAFADPSAVSPDGAFSITVKAYRPPSSSEASEANVLPAGSTSTSVVSGSFGGEQVSFPIPAQPSFVLSPVWRDGFMREGIASWYVYRKCLCAASPDVPKGTRMVVRRADDPSQFTVVTINDFGPVRVLHPDRVVDLDKVAFARIGNPRGGLLAVTVDVVLPDDPLWALGDELPPPNWKTLLADLTP